MSGSRNTTRVVGATPIPRDTHSSTEKGLLYGGYRSSSSAL
eukprot:CAMPEP_0204350738 /NCGR_PEP_ID=MMETSP0469-20131031/30577_1 /ASSEMBLY_ACC=CAM_ASM_000384 /TAXON_ID=2969 /ORGANISM="Oxyrrhis marina" /LENGTH=40 /DNA_ID= /DNA_START= /DNA_END= /DNA_ORIENTATION=